MAARIPLFMFTAGCLGLSNHYSGRLLTNKRSLSISDKSLASNQERLLYWR